MKHLGIQATKNFNKIQTEIKQIHREIESPLDGSGYKTHGDRYLALAPRRDELLKLRDKYL